MDPASLATSFSELKSAELASKVQYAVAAKVMESVKDQGAAVIALLQSAAQDFEEALSQANAATDPTRLFDVYG